MKYLSALSVVLLVSAALAQQEQPIDANCDRILNSMVDGCKSLREQLISPASMEPKVVCCLNFRYNIAVQSVQAYTSVAKATRICPEKLYDEKLSDLTNNVAMSAVKTLCDKFETQTCITDPVNNAWNSVKDTVQSNVNFEQIGQQIGKNWNDAVSSISNFAKNIGQTIQNQNIPGRLQEGASAIQSSIASRTKQLSDAVSGQGQNRYSLVGDDNKADSLSLDSIVHSVIPEVEIVEKKPEGSDAAAAAPANGKRFSFGDWFSSLTQSVNLGGSNPSAQAKPAQLEEGAQRRNPYSSA